MSPSSNHGVVADPLFVGITRPAMALGVPYAALLTNTFVTLEFFLLTKNLACLVVAIPLHGLAWLLCLAEPRFFELLAVWVRVRAAGGRGEYHRWRAISYGAFTSPRACQRRQSPTVIVESDARR